MLNAVNVTAQWSRQLRAIYELQRRHALRISEALRLTVDDLRDDDRIFIAAQKGSRDRLLHDAELHDALSKLAAAQTSGRIFDLSYSQVYRAYRRAGVVEPGPSSQRERVTHALRARRIQELREQGLTVEQIADEVGHVDPDSTRHYLSPKTSS